MNTIYSAIRRLINAIRQPDREASLAVSTVPAPVAPVAAASGIHPGLTDQQLVALLTVAACEVMDGLVRIEKFQPLTAKDWNWVAQGRSDLHSHRLK